LDAAFGFRSGTKDGLTYSSGDSTGEYRPDWDMANDGAGNVDAHIPEESHFGWSNMFVAPEGDPRSQVPSAGERATLTGFLQSYR
jgi:hypothetical protein